MLETEAKLADGDIEITAILYPPVPKRIASLTTRQCSSLNCKLTEILDRGSCNDERIRNMKEYWKPRLGEEILNSVIGHNYCVEFD